MMQFDLLFILFQAQEGIPKPGNNEPIDLRSREDLIIYIILPLVFLILYLIWRFKKRRKSDGD